MQRPCSRSTKSLREDLHVAREHDQLGLRRFDQLPAAALPARLSSLPTPANDETEYRRAAGRCAHPAHDWRRRRSDPSPVRRCASDRADRQGNDRSARPAASPAAAPRGRASATPSAARRRCRRKLSRSDSSDGASVAASNTTRMKKRPVSTSLNCCASRMFWPLSNRNAETAATIPGRSGQDRVRTSGWPDMAMSRCCRTDEGLRA